MQQKTEAFNWIESIIASCKNDFHFDAVDTLICLFIQKFENDFHAHALKMMRIEKWNEIHEILT